MEYYGTYSFAALIQDLAFNGFDLSEIFDDFIKDLSSDVFRPFLKFSVLHQFIAFVVRRNFEEEVDDVVLDSVVNNKNYILWVDDALKTYKITHLEFNDWLRKNSLTVEKLEHEDTILEYYEYLYEIGTFKELLQKIADEVFFVLLINRTFLYHFNKQLSAHIAKIKTQDLQECQIKHFKNDGVLKRVNIPIWARNAVFFRDRGICSNCQKNISGLLNLNNSKHFDHIVPLISGGLNDISNLQLLCETCNLHKGSKAIPASNIYGKWY
ncbi:hypothetical protein JCM14076_28220 [Methylosoma difficile]